MTINIAGETEMATRLMAHNEPHSKYRRPRPLTGRQPVDDLGGGPPLLSTGSFTGGLAARGCR